MVAESKTARVLVLLPVEYNAKFRDIKSKQGTSVSRQIVDIIRKHETRSRKPKATRSAALS